MSNMSINGTIKERASGILLTALGVSLMIATNVFSSARHVSKNTLKTKSLFYRRKKVM